MRNRLLVTVAAVLVPATLAGGGWIAYRNLHGAASSVRRDLEGGNLQDALARARADVRKDQARPDPHLVLADLALKVPDPTLAQAELQRARTAGADQWAVTTRLGPALLLGGKPAMVLERIPRSGPTPEITRDLLLARAAAMLAQGDAARAGLRPTPRRRPRPAPRP